MDQFNLWNMGNKWRLEVNFKV